MLILVFLSLERFLLIAVPLSGYQVLKLNTAVYCMVSIWLVGLSISVAPRKSYVILLIVQCKIVVRVVNNKQDLFGNQANNLLIKINLQVNYLNFIKK